VPGRVEAAGVDLQRDRGDGMPEPPCGTTGDPPTISSPTAVCPRDYAKTTGFAADSMIDRAGLKPVSFARSFFAVADLCTPRAGTARNLVSHDKVVIWRNDAASTPNPVTPDKVPTARPPVA
jgi:hypothetical protein